MPYFYGNANYNMWGFICDWLPVIAFLTGTGLGWLINALFEGAKKKHLENLYKTTSNANIALESQLVAKSRLEEDLGRTNSELEQLRKEVQALSASNLSQTQLQQENSELKKKVDKLKSRSNIGNTPSEKTQMNDYQLFLLELENSIKKAKKKAATPPKKEPSKVKPKKIDKEKKGKSKTKKKSKSKSKSKYDFYKEKYSSKKLGLGAFKPEASEKDLTYLVGITPEIQNLLSENGIESFEDLSLTKIGELKAILALAGKNFENVDPLNWPIQARIAVKGQWDILEEYKAKMEM